MAEKYISGVILDHISYQMLDRVGFFSKSQQSDVTFQTVLLVLTLAFPPLVIISKALMIIVIFHENTKSPPSFTVIKWILRYFIKKTADI